MDFKLSVTSRSRSIISINFTYASIIHSKLAVISYKNIQVCCYLFRCKLTFILRSVYRVQFKVRFRRYRNTSTY